MTITAITVFQRDPPLAEPYALSGGRRRPTPLDADAGPVGWGEATPWGVGSVPAHGPGLRAGPGTSAQTILGRAPLRLDGVERAMDARPPRSLDAQAPVATACWDVAAQTANRSLAAMPRTADLAAARLKSSASTGAPAAMAARWRHHRRRGHIVKIVGDDEDALGASLAPYSL